MEDIYTGSREAGTSFTGRDTGEHIVSFKAKGSIYQSFMYTVRPFCLEADDMYGRKFVIIIRSSIGGDIYDS